MTGFYLFLALSLITLILSAVRLLRWRYIQREWSILLFAVVFFYQALALLGSALIAGDYLVADIWRPRVRQVWFTALLFYVPAVALEARNAWYIFQQRKAKQ